MQGIEDCLALIEHMEGGNPVHDLLQRLRQRCYALPSIRACVSRGQLCPSAQVMLLQARLAAPIDCNEG